MNPTGWRDGLRLRARRKMRHRVRVFQEPLRSLGCCLHPTSAPIPSRSRPAQPHGTLGYPILTVLLSGTNTILRSWMHGLRNASSISASVLLSSLATGFHRRGHKASTCSCRNISCTSSHCHKGMGHFCPPLAPFGRSPRTPCRTRRFPYVSCRAASFWPFVRR
jgi:hypothetical protein